MPSKYRLQRERASLLEWDARLARQRYDKVLRIIDTFISSAYDREGVVDLLSTATVVDLARVQRRLPQIEGDWRARLQRLDVEADQIVASGLVPGTDSYRRIHGAPASATSEAE